MTSVRSPGTGLRQKLPPPSGGHLAGRSLAGMVSRETNTRGDFLSHRKAGKMKPPRHVSVSNSNSLRRSGAAYTCTEQGRGTWLPQRAQQRPAGAEAAGCVPWWRGGPHTGSGTMGPLSYICALWTLPLKVTAASFVPREALLYH